MQRGLDAVLLQGFLPRYIKLEEPVILQ